MNWLVDVMEQVTEEPVVLVAIGGSGQVMVRSKIPPLETVDWLRTFADALAADYAANVWPGAPEPEAE